MAAMDVQKVADSITTHLAQAMAEGGDHLPVVVDDVTIHPAGRRRLVRVVVARSLESLDSGDHSSTIEPLSLDEVSAATKRINQVLDETDVLGDSPYTLEVSSAGVGSALQTPDHYRRNVGRLLHVTVAPEGDAAGSSTGEGVTARLVAAEPDGIRLAEEPKRGKGRKASEDTSVNERFVRYDRIVSGKVEVEFSRGKDS